MNAGSWLRRCFHLGLGGAWAAMACAQSVQLDPAFRPTFSDGRAAGTFVALQPDGRIVADEGRVRYLADGTRDPGYALDPAIPRIFEATTAPDGRMFVRYPDARGNEAFALLTADGGIDAFLAATLSTMRDAVFQPDGKLIVAAESVQVGGAARVGPVRFNRDGSIDSTFDVGAGPENGGVDSLALQADGKVLLGGFFRGFDRTTKRHLVRLHPNGLVDAGFTAAVDNVVTAVIALPDGKIIAYDGIARRLVKLNANGSLDRVVGTVVGDVYAFAPAANGRVLALGGFSTIAGVRRRNLARINPDGSIDPAFDASASLRSSARAVRRFGVQPDGRIVVGSDNPSEDRLLRLNADGSVDLAFAVGAAGRPTFLTFATRSDGRIYVVGTFDAVNGVARPGVARLMPDGTLDAGFAPTAAPVVSDQGFDFDHTATRLRAAALPDGGVVLAGTLIAAGSESRQGLIRYTAAGALEAGLNPTLNAGSVIHSAVVLPDGRILAGGEFSTVNGQPRANLAAFRSDGSLDPSTAATAAANGPVLEFTLRNGGCAFVSGTFTTVDDERRNGLAALTATGALDRSFVPGGLSSSDRITALAATNDGGVVIAGPVPATGFARAALRRLSVSGEIDPGFVFPFAVNARFVALAVDSQGRVLAAYEAIETGDLGTTTSHFFLHRFLPSGAFDPSFNDGAGFSEAPSDLAVAADGSTLAGGAFTSFDNVPTSALVRLVPSADPAPRLLNVSTRAETSGGANALTAGFVIGGTLPKTVVLRAAGPSLAAFGVSGASADPSLILFQGAAMLSSNGNWSGFSPLRPQNTDLGFRAARAFERVGAFPLHSLDAALVVTLAPGPYTVQVRTGTNEPPGIVLVEVYDANVGDDRRLLNLSSRGIAGPGNRSLIAGFAIGGTASKTVLVRAIGPGLSGFNVEGALADPTLTLANNMGATVAANGDWGAGANPDEIARTAVRVGAFALQPSSRDAALLVTLAPGNYTAIVNGVNDTSGVALVEVYEVP